MTDIGSLDYSDDDAISLTSTVASEPQEFYTLDRILAEKDFDGVTKYLVKWEGYPPERNTWEEEDNFLQDATLPEWRDRKRRIARGQEDPFDVERWISDTKDYQDSTATRKARRR